MKKDTLILAVIGISFILIGLFIGLTVGLEDGSIAFILPLFSLLGTPFIIYSIKLHMVDQKKERINTITNTPNLKPNMNEIRIEYKENKDILQNTFPLLASQSINLLDSIITNTVNRFNLENNANLHKTSVTEMICKNFRNEISTYINPEQVFNRHFGIISITLICCNIIADITYQQLKITPDSWNNAKDFFEEAIPETLREDFLDTLDKTYIENIINLIDNCESNIFEKFNNEKEILDLLDYSLNFAQVFSLTVYNFSIINNLKLNEDGKIAIILFKCEVIITTYENPLPLKSFSCLNDIMFKIQEHLENYFLEMDKLEEQSHLLILTRCFNMLSSGEYHIHRGTLNTWTAPTILKVHNKCADWLLENKYFTKSEYEEHKKMLEQNILEVG